MDVPLEKAGRGVSWNLPLPGTSRYSGSCARFNSRESTAVTAVKDKCEGQIHKILTESFMPNLKVSKPNKISSKIYVLDSDRPYNNLFFFKYPFVHIASKAKMRVTTTGCWLLVDCPSSKRQHVPAEGRSGFSKAVSSLLWPPLLKQSFLGG